jgi:hypothetical protein
VSLVASHVISVAHCIPCSVTSPPPTHCDDDDIGIHLHARPKPNDHITDTSFGLVRSASLVKIECSFLRQVKSHLAAFQKATTELLTGKQVGYSDILELDARLQRTLKVIPTSCRTANSRIRPCEWATRLTGFARLTFF